LPEINNAMMMKYICIMTACAYMERTPHPHETILVKPDTDK